MTRALFLVAVATLSGCVRIDSTTRVERGPLLRTFERPVLMEGGVTADVRAQWPRLSLTVVQYDVCRAQTVEEYAEDHITERTSNAAGPTLSMGISLILASAILAGVSFAVSSAPDVNVIDRAGNYGASTRQYVQLASVLTGAVGVPALAVGLVTRLRTGDETVTERVEQITNQKDARCNERPATGPGTLVGERGEALAVQIVDGALDVDGAQVPLVPETIRFAERELELSDEARATLQAWSACVALEKEAPRPLEQLADTALLARAARLRECRPVRPGDMAPRIDATDAELSRRRETGGPAVWAPGTRVSSFEEAVSAYAPALTLAPGSTDLTVLDAPEAAEGRAVLLKGVVASGVSENIGVIQVGEREVFLFIPPQHRWGGEFPNGSRIEAVALLAGRQTLGEKNLPLLRAVWMRAAF